MTNLPQSQNSGSISDFQISGQSLIKENCHKSRTSDNIENKEKENKVTSKKKLTIKVVMSLLLFQFMANLEQSGNQIPDA